MIQNQYHLCFIVEFAESSAIHILYVDLYCQEYQSSADANISFKVRSLDSIYTRTASMSDTKGYLEELQAIADKSGKSIESVLQEELMKISAGKGVNLPTDTAPLKDTRLNTSNVTGEETENIKAPSQVMQQPSFLLGLISPETVRTLPTVFPPSPSPSYSQRGLRGDVQAASTPTLQRLEAANRSP